MNTGIMTQLGFTLGSKYLRMDQVKFVEDSLQKKLKALGIPYHFKAVFHKFYLIYS